MLGCEAVQWLLFPVGVFFLLLHAGPLARVARVPSIHGGTRWWFFALEVLLSTAWLLGAPAVWGSSVGRAALSLHLAMHVGFALADWFAHERVLELALVDRRRSPVFWAAGNLGLAIDTGAHLVAVVLVGLTLPRPAAALLAVPAVLGYRAMTRSYVRRFGAR